MSTAESRPLDHSLEATGGHSPWLIAFIVLLAAFMEVLDTSVANVALPHIAGSLSADVDESTWVLTSYLVSNAIVLPLSGWFSELFGRKRFYMACVSLFSVSSMLCGLAPNLTSLVIFRVLQGAGGGALQPIAQAIMVEGFPPKRRGMAMAIYGMGVIVAPIIGPTLGGWLTDTYTWRWVFFINLPVGILSLILTGIFLVDPPYLVYRGLRALQNLDYLGLSLLSVGLGCLQVVLDTGQRNDWFGSNQIRILSAIAAVALVGVVLWELWTRNPVVNLRLLGERNFGLSTLTMFVLGVVLYGSITLLPIFLQTLMGYTAMLAGLVLSPGGLVTLIVLPIVGRLLQRFEARWLVLVGVGFVTLSLFQMAGFTLQIDFRTAVYTRVVQGLGLAFLFVTINVMAFYYIPKEQANYASGLINLARNMGGSVGISLTTTLLARNAQIHQNYLVTHITPYSYSYQSTITDLTQMLMAQGSSAQQALQQAQAMIYAQVQQQANLLSFIDAFRLLGIAFLILVPLMFLMKPAKPDASHAPPMAH